jgi:hypothetical protein
MGKYTISEAKEHIVSRIQAWMDELDIVEEASEHRALEFIKDRLEADRMLYKADAKLLETRIEQELSYLMDSYANSNRMKVMLIDEWSIYSDVWTYFCRPGTYKIDI